MIIEVAPEVILDFFSEKIAPINNGCTAVDVTFENGCFKFKYLDPYKAASDSIRMIPTITRDTFKELQQNKVF